VRYVRKLGRVAPRPRPIRTGVRNRWRNRSGVGVAVGPHPARSNGPVGRVGKLRRQRPQAGRLHFRRGAGACGGRDDRAAGSVGRGADPARTLLVAAERPPRSIQAAVAEPAGDGAAEMLAARAGDRRAATDPADRGLVLGGSTVRAAPARHGPIVAAGSCSHQRSRVIERHPARGPAWPLARARGLAPWARQVVVIVVVPVTWSPAGSTTSTLAWPSPACEPEIGTLQVAVPVASVVICCDTIGPRP